MADTNPLVEQLAGMDKIIFKEWAVSADFFRAGQKTTVCLVTLVNGFELVGTSACVDPSDFNEDMGKRLSLDDAIKQLHSHSAFVRQIKLAEGRII